MAAVPTENTEFIEMLPQSVSSPMRWLPTIGSETLELLKYLNLKPDETERLQEESALPHFM
jgi:hypothetical protein